MKKVIALLLMLCMLLALCACGGTGAAPAAGGAEGEAQTGAAPAEPTEEPEPEKTFVSRQRNLLTRAEEEGVPDYRMDDFGPVRFSGKQITEYSYDEFGLPSGESVHYLDDTTEDFLHAADTYVRDREWAEENGYQAEFNEAGEPVSVTRSAGMTYNFLGGGSYSSTLTGTFENGLLTKIVEICDQNGEQASETVREYYPDGSLMRETTTAVIVPGFFSAYRFEPEDQRVSVKEYREDGRCTLIHLEGINEDYMLLSEDEYRWEFDEAGDPVALTVKDHEDVVCSLEMRYDGEHRMISGVKTADGETTEYTYSYDADGRLAGVKRLCGDKELSSAYEYDERGLPVADRRSGNVSPKDVTYTWEEEGNGRLEGSCSSDDRHESIFPSSSCTIYPDRKDEKGNLSYGHSYVLLPSAVTLEPVYMNFDTEYVYEDHSVLEEISPEALADLSAALEPLDSYYPDLPASFCGIPVPKPNGTERLVKAVVEHSGGELDLVTEFLYDQNGTLVGAESSFDTRPESNAATDEQGRMIENKVGDDLSFVYTYGDDPKVYQFDQVHSGSTYSQTITLEEQLLPNWIKKDPAELEPYYSFTFNEDGLFTRAESTGYTAERSYSAETYEDGSLKSVRAIYAGEEYSFEVICFDRAGYLTYYTKGMNAGRITYYYE